MRSIVVFLVSLVVVGVLSLGGCSALDPNADPAAVAKCDDWANVYCDRMASCGSALTRSQCLSAVATHLDCSKAAAVSPSYGRCLTELRQFDCGVFDQGATLPASCDGAIEVAK